MGIAEEAIHGVDECGLCAFRRAGILLLVARVS